MIIYEIRNGKIYNLTAAGTATELAVDAGVMLSQLYHAQASDDLKAAFREKVEWMITSGVLWGEDMKEEDQPATLSLDLANPMAAEIAEEMEEAAWRKRHEDDEEKKEE